MIVKKSFGGAEVAFEPSLINGNVMVNATQMAKAFGKDAYDFLKISSTQKFIEAFCQTEDLRFGDEFLPGGKVVKIQKGDKSVSGTWMHRILALKFAAWLDPFFEVWVYKTIDEILYSFSREQDASIRRTLVIQEELKQLEKKGDKSGEDFERFIKLNGLKSNEQIARANATKCRFREMYRDLKPTFQNN